jgi:hypothetical protein
VTSSALDKQIAASPDSPDSYLVLADELLAKGDRHGELIVLQGRKRSAKVVKREAELLKELAPQLFGDLAKIVTRRVKKNERGPLHVEWHMGFPRAVRFSCVDEDKDTELARIVPLFLKLPVARFVQQLSFGGVNSEHSNHDYGDVIELLAAHRPPSTVNSLFFGDFEREDWEAKYNLVGGWGALSKTFPKLARLRIHSCGDGLAKPIDLAGLALPHLRGLEIVTDYTNSPKLLAQVQKLPRLERLSIDFGVNTHDEPTLADLKPFLAGKPPLTSLSLAWLDFGPALVDALPASKLAARIEHLGILSAHLHDASVDVLVANKAKFPKLASVDLGLNYLTKPAQARAKKICAKVVVVDQWKPSEDWLLD